MALPQPKALSRSLLRSVLLLACGIAAPVVGASEPSLTGKTQHLTSPEQTPKGLAPSEWTSIRAAYEAGRHQFQPVEGKDGQWQARNPGQQWLTTFDQHGFEATPQGGGWTWGLQLQSYGFGEKQTPVSGTPAVKAEGQRLSYQWDATVQEWFVNDRRGLEHGFTLGRKPSVKDQSDQSDLSFTITTRGSLKPQVSAQGVSFLDASGTSVLSYSGLKVWDADGKVLPSRFEPAGDKAFRLLVDERSARYPLTIDPIAQQGNLVGSNTDYDDYFGLTSVSVSGDTVVIGAPQEDSNATGVNGNQADNSARDSGAAYVFVRSGSTWTQEAYLKASNSESYSAPYGSAPNGDYTPDHFGWSVAVSGDTIIVGATGEDSSATGVNGNQADNTAKQSGAAYVFTRSGTTWTQQAYLKASDSRTNMNFGWLVALSGETALISQTQMVYVFNRSGTTWSQQATLVASNAEEFDDFARAIAIDGDTVVIGAPREDSNATGVNGNQANNTAVDSGAAYVFVRSGTTWTQQAYLKASNTGWSLAGSDEFGSSVAVSGNTIVVGAPGEASDNGGVAVNGDQSNNDNPGAGAAYVFVRSGTTWTQQAYLKSYYPYGGYVHGTAVGVSGDIVVVSTPAEAYNAALTSNRDAAGNSLNASGTLYVYKRTGTTWAVQQRLKTSTAKLNDRLGQKMAFSGDTVIATSASGVHTFGAPPAPPTLTSVAPATGSIAGGTAVTLTGTGFTGVTGVTFDGVAATAVSVASSTTLTCTTPAGTAGTASVLVAAAGGTNAANTRYTYVTAPAPTVNSVAPTSGSTLGGTLLTVTGTGFTGATSVTVGGAAATGVTVVNATTLTCNTPVGTAGAASVRVTTPGGINAPNTLYTYVVPAPLVASISPSTGSTAGGTQVTLTGTALTGATGVTFQGMAATNVTVVSPTSITCTVPAGSAGTASVIVTTLGGSNAANTLYTYTLLAPTVASVAPASGPTTGGTNVTITGTGFTGVTGVTFDGATATNVSVVNGTTITCTTPAGTAGTAGTASVLVTAGGGTNAANTRFAYIAVPLIGITGNTLAIANGDTTPSSSDGTDFDPILVRGDTITRTYTIRNTGTAALALAGNPRVAITGPAATDFTVTTPPAASVAVNGTSTFVITFNPSAPGVRTATVTVPNSDATKPNYTFTISGVGIVLNSVEIYGNNTLINSGDTSPATADGTDFGSTPLFLAQTTRSFVIYNSSASVLNLTGAPLVQITGANAADFSVTSAPFSPVPAVGETNFGITFDPTGPGLRTATVTVRSGTNPTVYTFGISGFGSVGVDPQTITFAPPATLYQTQSPYALSATATSGLPVTLTYVSGPATLSGSVLSLTGIGTVKLTATQAGNGSFAPAAAVTRSIVVPANPTSLTLLNLAQTYDGSPKPISTTGAVGPTITYKIGAVEGSTPPTAAGSYPVKAVAGTLTKTGTLVIAKAVLTITPDDKAKFVGEANPPLTYTVSGYRGTDTASVILTPPALSTTATVTSVAGIYPIKAVGGTALNYTFNYQIGSMIVGGFAGNYEALLLSGSLPVGKLTITVPATGRTFTGSLAVAAETAALPLLSNALTTDPLTSTASGTVTVTKNTIPYAVTFALTQAGVMTASVTRSSVALGSATDGRRTLVLPAGTTVNYAGNHTVVLSPASPATIPVPKGAGWATATIATTGTMALAGKLADGTSFTATLLPDIDANPSYRLWVQPYLAARTESFLGGSFTLIPHPNPNGSPELVNRRRVPYTDLTWKKTGLPADLTHRTSFGPVSTVMTLDPWLAPKTTVPTITLATRLGLFGTAIKVSHSPTGSAADGNLPSYLALSATNVITVTTPAANATLTKWKILTLVPTTGTFTGSFELLDGTVKRPATFSGILRQPYQSIGSDPIIGDGHYIVPPLTGTEKLTGEVLFQR